MKNKQELELYIHIPFCMRKCAYCDFLSFPADEAARAQYVDALVREIGAYAGSLGERNVVSVFFGGGTPSLLKAEQMRRIMEVLRTAFRIREDAEISIECNPGTVDRQKLDAYRACGINRLSFGLQSANDDELRLLGRIHRMAAFRESFALARAAGFANINVDLMSALPGQTVESWAETLREVLALSPEHISAYSLIIEEGTPFYTRYHEDDVLRAEGEKPKALPDEESERQMVYLTEKLLGEHGYEHYEISNYAKPGYACQHNIGYWQRRDYLGLGLGAASLLGDQRFTNTADLSLYIEGMQSDGEDCGYVPEHIRCDVEKLKQKDAMEETMFLGLRMMEGVSQEKFREQFGQTIEQVYGEVLQKLQREALLEVTPTYVRLTGRGIDVSNGVMAEFLLDD